MIATITSKTRHNTGGRVLRPKANHQVWFWHALCISPTFVLLAADLFPSKLGWILVYLHELLVDNNNGPLMALSILFLMWMAWAAAVQLARAVLNREFRRTCRVWWYTTGPDLARLGLRRPRISWWMAGALMVSTFLGMFLISLTYGLAVTHFGWSDWAGDSRNFSSSNITYQVLVIILAVICAPLIEELVIRGMFLRFLILGATVPSWRMVALGSRIVMLRMSFRGLGTSNLGILSAIVLAGLAFGILHPLGNTIPTAMMGISLGFLRVATGSLYPGMVVHALWNSMVMTMAVL